MVFLFLSLHICCIKDSILTLFLLCTYRGPTIGFQGKVVLAFEDNASSKIGIRFDNTVPDGNDLGGLCEEDHGFFCAGNWRAFISNFNSLENILFYWYLCVCAASSLRLDGSSGDDADKLAINEIFEVHFTWTNGRVLLGPFRCRIVNPLDTYHRSHLVRLKESH